MKATKFRRQLRAMWKKMRDTYTGADSLMWRDREGRLRFMRVADFPQNDREDDREEAMAAKREREGGDL
jgi:hypothetical protein